VPEGRHGVEQVGGVVRSPVRRPVEGFRVRSGMAEGNPDPFPAGAADKGLASRAFRISITVSFPV